MMLRPKKVTCSIPYSVSLYILWHSPYIFVYDHWLEKKGIIKCVIKTSLLFRTYKEIQTRLYAVTTSATYSSRLLYINIFPDVLQIKIKKSHRKWEEFPGEHLTVLKKRYTSQVIILQYCWFLNDCIYRKFQFQINGRKGGKLPRKSCWERCPEASSIRFWHYWLLVCGYSPGEIET